VCAAPVAAGMSGEVLKSLGALVCGWLILVTWFRRGRPSRTNSSCAAFICASAFPRGVIEADFPKRVYLFIHNRLLDHYRLLRLQIADAPRFRHFVSLENGVIRLIFRSCILLPNGVVHLVFEIWL
jgi:hypothetical protein